MKNQNKRVCPKCLKHYSEPPAISRDDNVTEICSKCGAEEAIQAFKRSFR